MSAEKVLVLQHVPPENLGTIADAFDRRQIAAHYIRPFQGEPVPKSLEWMNGLVVMGGPMGIADRERMPFLKDEIHLVESALHEKKPILGICLGSQLLAHALGSKVTRADRKEIGWSLVRLSEEGRGDPLFADVEHSFFALHWHGDVFELPGGAVSLASSEQTACQAFRYSRNAYGLLFHLETTENTLREMIRTFSDELKEENLDGGRLLQKGKEHFPPLERVSEKVFGHWAGMV